MRRILIVAGLIIAIALLFRFCEFKKQDDGVTYETNLIQQQIRNVGKLVVTEGHFAEVLTYKDQDKYLLNLLSFEKKALIIVNADVTVSYDLHQVSYDVDEKNKTITITSIPKEEIRISPDLKFYDVQQSRFNAFSAEDYNKVNAAVRANLARKIDKSTLKSNAKNRLVSELSKMLVLTQTLGWTLKYQGETVSADKDLELKL